MISGPGELREANHLLEEVKKNLRQEGIAFDEDMQFGLSNLRKIQEFDYNLGKNY